MDCSKIGKLYYSVAQQKKSRIALYIKDTLEPKLINADEEGRILMVTINQKRTLLIAIYAPNNKEELYKII